MLVLAAIMYEMQYIFSPELMQSRRKEAKEMHEDIKADYEGKESPSRKKVMALAAEREAEEAVKAEFSDFRDDLIEEIDRKEKLKRDVVKFMYSSLGLCAMTVNFVGMMSSQWFLFILYFAANLTFSAIYKHVDKIYVHVIDGCICTTLLTLVVLNKFHFHVKAHDIWILMTS